MSLVYSVDSVSTLDKYLDSDHNYSHQGLYKIVEYYNNLNYDLNLDTLNIRSIFFEYELDDIITDYNIPDQTYNFDDMSLAEYITYWVQTVTGVDKVWYLPFPETFLVKHNG